MYIRHGTHSDIPFIWNKKIKNVYGISVRINLSFETNDLSNYYAIFRSQTKFQSI